MSLQENESVCFTQFGGFGCIIERVLKRRADTHIRENIPIIILRRNDEWRQSGERLFERQSLERYRTHKLDATPFEARRNALES